MPAVWWKLPVISSLLTCWLVRPENRPNTSIPRGSIRKLAESKVAEAYNYLMHSDVEDVDLFKKVGQEETIG